MNGSATTEARTDGELSFELPAGWQVLHAEAYLTGLIEAGGERERALTLSAEEGRLLETLRHALSRTHQDNVLCTALKWDAEVPRIDFLMLALPLPASADGPILTERAERLGEETELVDSRLFPSHVQVLGKVEGTQLTTLLTALSTTPGRQRMLEAICGTVSASLQIV